MSPRERVHAGFVVQAAHLGEEPAERLGGGVDGGGGGAPARRRRAAAVRTRGFLDDARREVAPTIQRGLVRLGRGRGDGEGVVATLARRDERDGVAIDVAGRLRAERRFQRARRASLRPQRAQRRVQSPTVRIARPNRARREVRREVRLGLETQRLERPFRVLSRVRRRTTGRFSAGRRRQTLGDDGLDVRRRGRVDAPPSPDGHAAQMFRSDGPPERRRVRAPASFEVREKFGGFDGGRVGKISRRRREVQRGDGEKTSRRARHVRKKTRHAKGFRV